MHGRLVWGPWCGLRAGITSVSTGGDATAIAKEKQHKMESDANVHSL